jgi:lactate permease
VTLTVLALVGRRSAAAMPCLTFRRIVVAWSPFLLLAGFIAIWGAPSVSKGLDSLSWRHPVPGLDLQVVRTLPMVMKPRLEPALFEISWLATPGTAGFLAALIAAPLAGLSFRKTFHIFSRLLWQLRSSVLAIALLAAMAYITRYSGMDATIGVGISKTGALFPFFAATIGWLGAVFSGTAAGSNAMFGGLQVTTARSLGLNPILLGSANAAGGAMGKMLSAQSLVVACAAAGQEGGEGDVFGAVARQSLGLLGMVAILVFMLAYVNA